MSTPSGATALRVLNVLFEDRYSGPVNRVLQVAKELSGRGVETVLCLPEGRGNAEHFASEAGVPVRRVPCERVPRPSDPGRVFRWALHLPGDVRRFVELYRRERPDVVHVSGAFFLPPALATRLARVPLVWHLNDTLVPARVAPLFGLLVRSVAERIVTSSESVAEHYGVSGVAHEVIYTPVDPRRFGPGERSTDGRSRVARVGLVGNWNPLKGHEQFVRAAALVKERLAAAGRGVEFVLAGQRLETYPDYARRVDGLISYFGLRPYFRDLGFVNPIFPVLRELDVLVSCSTAEAAAQTAIVEAMATGIPVVVTDVGGVREMLGEEGEEAGLVVPPGDPEATASAVVFLLSSPEEAKRMGHNGRRLALERFSLKNSARKHEQVYRGTRRDATARHAVFVDQFYYPDSSAIAQLLTELTVGLKERGWRVGVVTSRDEYAKPERPAPVDPEAVGVEVRRTPRLAAGSIRRRRLLRQLWFYATATLGILAAPAPPLYVAQTTPPLTPACVALAARLKRRPYALIAQDIYPEILSAHGLLDPSKGVYRLIKLIVDRAYQGAVLVVSLGPYMTRRLLEKGVKGGRIEEISNWGVGDVRPWTGPNPLRQEWGLEDKFVVLYSGNMGLGHEFETFLEGAAGAKAELPELAVVFVGGGPRRKGIEAWVSEHGAEGWTLFRPYQPLDRLRESLGMADLSLVTMREGWKGLVVPSKVLGILAMGSPSLYVGPESDVSVLLDRFAAGAQVRNGDVRGVRDAILRAARDEGWRRAVGENAARGYNKYLSRDAMIDRYDKALSRVLG